MKFMTRAPITAFHFVLLGLLALAAPRAVAQPFASQNVTLRSWLPLTSFTPLPDNGNDCWGYVSPSGREYALMGLSNQVAVVEITNPVAPVIRGSISHTNSLWCGIKVFGGHAYASNESGGGLDVISLTNIDSSAPVLLQRVTTGGLATAHTVAVNEASGFLYLCGSNLNGGRLRAFNLANPASPAFAGVFTGAGSAYVHEAQVVTYNTGPYAGREIAFCCNGGVGFDIVDVTNKANMFLVSHSTYPNLSYCHQGWLNEGRTHFYINDETDGVNETVIFNVTNIATPVLAGTYTSGLTATDHNQYVRGNFIFESDYHSGLRIYCNENPTAPVQVGYFDSYSQDDAGGYDGAWSNYPFFPSGLAIISDIDRGLFIVDPSAALAAGALAFSYPLGRPAFANPAGGTVIRVAIAGTCGSSLAASSPMLHYNTGGGYVTVAMQEIGPGLYEGQLSASPCGTTILYYISAASTGGGIFTDPTNAPANGFSALSGLGFTTVLSDNFQTDMGWTTEVIGATSGGWQRGIPVNDPNWAYDPVSDSDGSGQCYLTENDLGNTDVDGGSVRLISPVLDMSDPNSIVSYDYFLRLTAAGDELRVEINPTGGVGTWTTIANHTTDGGLTWRHSEISASQITVAGVSLTSNTKLRFTASDLGTQSIVEAGLDAFKVVRLICPAVCAPADGDLNGDSASNGNDVQTMVTALLGTPTQAEICHGDFNANGLLDPNDIPGFTAALTQP